jgi:hypothetical protein
MSELLIQSLESPSAQQRGRWFSKLLSNPTKLLQPGNRNADAVDLCRVSSTAAGALPGGGLRLAALFHLGLPLSRFRLGRQHVSNPVAHSPSRYSFSSDGFAAHAVAPHQRTPGGLSFGATITVTTKPADLENPVTLTVTLDVLPVERTQRRMSWHASVAHSA